MEALHLYAIEVRLPVTQDQGWLYSLFYRNQGANPVAQDVFPSGDPNFQREYYYVPANTSGPYFIKLESSAASAAVDGYEIRVLDLGLHAEDDHGDRCSEGTPSFTDGRINSAFLTDDDYGDYFSFQGEALHRYEIGQFQLSWDFGLGVSVLGGDCVTDLTSYFALSSYDYTYTGYAKTFVVPYTGTFYIEIDSAGSSYGYASFIVNDLGPVEDDHGNTPPLATIVDPDGQIHSGIIQYEGDVDVIVATLAAHHLYTIEFQANNDGDAWLKLDFRYAGQFGYKYAKNIAPARPRFHFYADETD